MRADEGDLSVAHQQAWALLMRSNRPPWLFRRGGQPTWIVYDDDSAPMTVAITEDRLRYMLAQLAKWFRMTKDGPEPAHPPAALVRSLLATPNPGLPVLSRIAIDAGVWANRKAPHGPRISPRCAALVSPRIRLCGAYE